MDQVSAPASLTSEEREVLFHTNSSAQEDIERTKKRQFEVTNYSAVASAALAGAVKFFADDKIATAGFYREVLILLALNAVASIGIQIMLWVAMFRFRRRLQRSWVQLGQNPRPVWEKMARDTVFILYFLGVALVGAFIAIQYVEFRSCLTPEACVRLLP